MAPEYQSDLKSNVTCLPDVSLSSSIDNLLVQLTGDLALASELYLHQNYDVVLVGHSSYKQYNIKSLMIVL